MAAYDEGIASRPERANIARELRLFVAAAAGSPGPMLAFYDGNVSAHPEDRSLPNASCWVRAMTGFDLQHARAFCDAAVAAGRPGHSLVNRAMVELQLGDNRQALRDLLEALANKGFRDHPFYAQAIYGRGLAKVRMGDRGGTKDIRAALKLNPNVEADFAVIGLKA